MPRTIAAHLVDGVGGADVVTASEFVHVAVEVLRAHPVVGSDVAALEHGPKALDAVRVRLAR